MDGPDPWFAHNISIGHDYLPSMSHIIFHTTVIIIPGLLTVHVAAVIDAEDDATATAGCKKKSFKIMHV